jgi:hypothetical protein
VGIAAFFKSASLMVLSKIFSFEDGTDMLSRNVGD